MTPSQQSSSETSEDLSPPSPMAKWHALVISKNLETLDEILAEDAVFISPAMNTPQLGKALVCKYLHAALLVLNNETFHYAGEWISERSCVLEFETTVDGLSINGVDIIRWNEAGLVIEFKVMIRPFKALNHITTLMGAQLRAG